MNRRALLIWSRKPSARIALIASAMLAGSLLFNFIVRFTDLHAEQAELRGYAWRLSERGEDLGREVYQAIDAVVADKFPYCSEQQIAFMRNLVFGSQHIRDVGRVRNGHLVCSSGVGQVNAPTPNGPPDIIIGDARLWTNAHLVISSEARGFIFEAHGVSVVIHPSTFKAMTEPSFRHAMEYLYDRPGKRMVPVAGPPTPLSIEEIVAGRFIERNGIFYQPLCRHKAINCTVASERKSDFLLQTRRLRIVRTLGGGAIGGLIAVILILLDQRRRSMESQLRRAIRKGNLTLAYQPIVDLATEAVIGAETLVRWTDEDGTFVPPDVFVSLAESRGFVAGITRHVMHGLVAELGDLLAQGRLRVTFNITSQDLASSAFLRELNLCVDLARIEHAFIGLELTERSTAPEGVPARVLRELKDAGYTLYIDDFGTGYSSLAYLHRLSVDAIKIDRAFTQTVGTDAVTASVVPQILEMANRLDLQVVVEGIETTEQAAYFRAAKPGIEGQGWLYSKAIPAAALRKLITDRSTLASNASAQASPITSTS